MGAQSVGVKGTAQTSSFSGSASRQERRLRNEIPACLERGTIIGHQGFQRAFRKNRCSGKRTHLVQNTSLPAKSRTTDLSPFGELIRATGPMSKMNPFRFSTKYQDDETDMVYYGYRYYSASTGRWLSRDPIEEDGGLNLYGFVKNISSSNIDMLGMASVSPRADGTFVVDVESCEIVRVTDDGIANKKAYLFLFPKAAGPSAASFMGCYAGSVNRSIKSKHQIEGSPMWNDTVSPYTEQADWIEARDKTASSSQALAISWLNQCLCLKVKVTRIEKNGEEVSSKIFNSVESEGIASWMNGLEK